MITESEEMKPFWNVGSTVEKKETEHHEVFYSLGESVMVTTASTPYQEPWMRNLWENIATIEHNVDALETRRKLRKMKSVLYVSIPKDLHRKVDHLLSKRT